MSNVTVVYRRENMSLLDFAHINKRNFYTVIWGGQPCLTRTFRWWVTGM